MNPNTISPSTNLQVTDGSSSPITDASSNNTTQSVNSPSQRMRAIYKPTGQVFEIDADKYDPGLWQETDFKGNSAITDNPTLHGIASFAANAAPVVGGIGGALLGSVAGPVGTIGGGAAGGAIGQGIKDYINQQLLGTQSQDLGTNLKGIGLQGAEQGAFSAIPGVGEVGGNIVKAAAGRALGGGAIGAASSVMDDLANNPKEDTGTLEGNAVRSGISNAVLMGAGGGIASKIGTDVLSKLPLLNKVINGQVDQSVVEAMNKSPEQIISEVKQGLHAQVEKEFADNVHTQVFKSNNADFAKENNLLGSNPIQGIGNGQGALAAKTTQNALSKFYEEKFNPLITPSDTNKVSPIPLSGIAQKIAELQGTIPQNKYNSIVDSFTGLLAKNGLDSKNVGNLLKDTRSTTADSKSALINPVLGKSSAMPLDVQDFKKSIPYSPETKDLYQHVADSIANSSDNPEQVNNLNQTAKQFLDAKYAAENYNPRKMPSKINMNDMQSSIDTEVDNRLKPIVAQYQQATTPQEKIGLIQKMSGTIHNLSDITGNAIGFGLGGYIGGRVGAMAGRGIGEKATSLIGKVAGSSAPKAASQTVKAPLTAGKAAANSIMQDLAVANMKSNNSNYNQ